MNLKKVDKKISKEIVSKLLKDVKLEGFENRKIKALSGGQMQRVALARALASNPKILLLDEPFSGLDEKLRLEMGDLVKKLQRENNLTMILVTHDKNEALQLSDKIAIMMDGEIIQYDTPLDLYTKPNSKKVADYFGKNNYFLGNVKNNVFKCEYFEFEKNIDDGEYEIMVRPSHIYIDNQKDDFLIEDISYLGDFVKIKLSNNIVANVRYSLLEKYNLKVGNKVGIKIKEATFF
jgi:ABC-type Fe3+/spermidine/putrescine transport system ATPase subunit